jgi:hypothetical protein
MKIRNGLRIFLSRIDLGFFLASVAIFVAIVIIYVLALVQGQTNPTFTLTTIEGIGRFTELRP